MKLLFVALLVLGGFAGALLGILSRDANNVQPEKVLAVATSSPRAIVTSTSTPTPTQKPVTTVAQAGTKTGSIIEYNEWCSGQKIKIYQNELITKVSSLDNKTYTMTQGDWDCYYNNVNRPAPSNGYPTYTYAPLPTLAPWPAYTPVPTYTLAPTPTTSPEQAEALYNQYLQQVKKCKADVHYTYNQIVQSCYARFGGSGSTGPACEQITNMEREKALKACE